jgi:hypothetical protein
MPPRGADMHGGGGLTHRRRCPDCDTVDDDCDTVDDDCDTVEDDCDTVEDDCDTVEDCDGPGPGLVPMSRIVSISRDIAATSQGSRMAVAARLQQLLHVYSSGTSTAAAARLQ